MTTTPIGIAPTGPAPPPLHVMEILGNAIVGGMESWVERLIERLPRRRFTVTLVCPFESAFTARLRAAGTEVIIVAMPDDGSWISVQATLALVRSRGIGLLHAHLPNAHLLAGLVGQLARVPVLTTVHGRQIGLLDLEVHHACHSHVSVVCRQTYLHALGVGVRASHLSFEANGVDTAVYAPRLRQAGVGLRHELGLADDAVLLGFVGRLSHEKGPDVFVHAAVWLRGLAPRVHSVVIGDGPMREALAQLIRQQRLQRRVHLLGARADLPTMYGELDAVMSSSHSEAMPLALMEAMACGLPVIATRVGGVPDIVVQGQTGWLVSAGDAQGLAAHATRVLGDKGLGRAMGQRGRQRALELFNLDDSQARVEALMTRTARGLLAEPVALLEAAGFAPLESRR